MLNLSYKIANNLFETSLKDTMRQLAYQPCLVGKPETDKGWKWIWLFQPVRKDSLVSV